MVDTDLERTYPTLYMSLQQSVWASDWEARGSSFTRFTNSSTTAQASTSDNTCTNTPLGTQLPLDRSDLFFPLHVSSDVLPPTATEEAEVLSWMTAQNINLRTEPVPPAMYSYLNHYSALSSFYDQNGVDIRSCTAYICPPLGGAGSPPPSPIPVSHHTGKTKTKPPLPSPMSDSLII
jgi:hypothetical protein